MAIRSLNRLAKVRAALIAARRWWLNHVRNLAIDPTASISLSSRLVTATPAGIVVGPETLIAFKTLLYTWDEAAGRNRPIRIGRRCFIGGGSMVMPGVTIGDEVVVGAGAVVMHDVPSRSIVGGNPARVLRSDVVVGPYGRLDTAIETGLGWKV